MEAEIRKIIDLYFNPNFGRELAVELLRGYNYEFIEMFENGQFENIVFNNVEFKVEIGFFTFDCCQFRNCKFDFEISDDDFNSFNSRFIDCQFKGLSIEDAEISSEFLSGVFENCKFDDIEIHRGTITGYPDFFENTYLKFEETDFEGLGKEINDDHSFIFCTFNNCDFSNKRLDKWNLLDNQYSDCIFVNAYLSIDGDDELGISGDFREATFCGTFIFYNVDVDGADFSEANFFSESGFKMSMRRVLAPWDVDQYFIDCAHDFSETSFADYLLSELIFEEIDLYDVDFSGADLEGAIFMKCNLNVANFQDAILDGAVFIECDLTDADFTNSSMLDTVFKDCIDVKENIYHYSFYEIEDYDFEEALGEKLKLRADYIFDKKLKFDDFDGYALDSVDFSGIQMEFVSFKNASLVNADFSNSVLTDVDFSGANLTHANFTNAVLINVIFEDALLENAVFDEDYRVDLFESYVEEGVEEPDDEDIYSSELDWEDL